MRVVSGLFDPPTYTAAVLKKNTKRDFYLSVKIFYLFALITLAWFDLYGLRRAVSNEKRNIKNENICLRQESNQRPLAFQSGASNHS